MNVRTLCLGILEFGDASGYEIRKLASEGAFSHFIEASYGAIYPALNKLTDDGLVTWHEEREPGKPTKKIYAITEDGRTELAQALATMPRADLFKSETLFTALFAHLVAPDHLAAILKTYRQQHAAEIERLQCAADCCQHPGTQFAIRYGLAINTAALAFLDTEARELAQATRTTGQTSPAEPTTLAHTKLAALPKTEPAQ